MCYFEGVSIAKKEKILFLCVCFRVCVLFLLIIYEIWMRVSFRLHINIMMMFCCQNMF